MHMPSSRTVQQLNGLIRTCRNGEVNCRAWSGAADSEELRGLLLERSEEWARQADELQALVLLFGGRPASLGSWTGHLLAAWIELKSALLGRNDLPVLLDWEHAQRGAMRRYRHALEGRLPERIRRTVTLQAQRLFAHQHLLEELCGRFNALSR